MYVNYYYYYFLQYMYMYLAHHVIDGRDNLAEHSPALLLRERAVSHYPLLQTTITGILHDKVKVSEGF